ncbi:MAG: hypothetical protein O2818_08230 [Bacteroidetes bacterium]|nr:hypothetical protein [Bacteroidota bacterium]MDA1336858.1 hypothetical protein [Bacteroidota bacterium]
MRNLIISYRKLPAHVRDSLNTMYPHGYEDDVFEFELPGRQMICKALRITIEGVNYLIKLEQRPKNTDYLLDEDW